MEKDYKKIYFKGIAEPNLRYPFFTYFRKISLIFLLCILMPFACRCPYGFKVNSLPGHLQTIAIPTFENETFNYGLNDAVTQALHDEIGNDGSLKIRSNVESVDSILEGKVTAYQKGKLSYDEDGTVKEYKISITVSWVFTDKIEKKVYAKNTRSVGFHTYLVPETGDSEELENEAKEEAITKLAEDIVTKIVQNW